MKHGATPPWLVHHLLRGFVALLSPGSCRLCERRLLQPVDHPVCEVCLEQLRALPLNFTCSICSEPLAPEGMHAFAPGESLCSACTATRPKFVRATAFGLYDDLRPAIRLLKFEGVPALSKPLGSLLADAILQLQPASPATLAVMPVPLFRGKRSYNQSALLAEQALRRVRRVAPGWVLCLKPGLLHRTRQTESQFLLSPEQRRQNLHGAFKADSAVQGQDVLLVDDVYTTGATAHECTRTLLAAGARSVRIATLARAGRDIAVRWQPPIAASWAGTTPAIVKGDASMCP